LESNLHLKLTLVMWVLSWWN